MPDYFTLEEFRDLPQMGDGDKYPDERVESVAAALTSIVERAVGTSFVARTFTRTLNGTGTEMRLPSPFVLSVTSATADGGPGGPYTVENGILFGTWPAGIRNVAVTYEAGYSEEPPADLKEALMYAVRDRLLATSSTAGIDARRTSLITDQGTVNYVVAGRDNPTGYPDLDAAILGWRSRLFGFGYV